MVTGGAGFIGSATIRHLVATGAAVVNVDHMGYAATEGSTRAVAHSPLYCFERADIRDPAALQGVLARHQPDAVLHLAAQTHVDRSIDSPVPFIDHNVLGTTRLLEAVRAYWSALPDRRRNAFRFVHVSTDEVFGSLGLDDTPFDRSSRYLPNSPYAASKAASDHVARA